MVRALLLAALAWPALGQASLVIYQYTGSPFTFALNNDLGPAAATYTLSETVVGSFAVAQPLAGGLVSFNVVPASFSFSDGHHTYTDANVVLGGGSAFVVSTDANGDISGWTVSLLDENNNTPFEPIWVVATQGGSHGNAFDYANTYTCGSSCAFNIGTSKAENHVAGSWQTIGADIAVPVPATVTLALGGLAALGLSRRRRVGTARVALR